MENNEQKKKSKRSGISAAVWISAALLLILVFTTIALLAATIKNWPQGDENVIALFPSDPNNKSVYTIDRVPADFEPSVSLGGSTGDGGTSDGPMYESGNVVDLFKNTYLNADGEVVVESANGDKVVAPGTENTYQFTLRNTGNVSLDYTLKLDGSFKYGDATLPLVVRLSYGDEWIIGDADTWIPWGDMKDTFDTRTIKSGDNAIYSFEWKWPYETDSELLEDMNNALLGADKNDTSLGNAATDTSTKFDLNIRTVAVVTEGAVAVDSFGSRLFTNVFNKLDVTYIGVYIIIIVVVVIALEVLFVYFFIIKRKKKEEEEKEPEPEQLPIPEPVAVPAMAEPTEAEPEPEPEIIPEPVPVVADAHQVEKVTYGDGGKKVYINLDTISECFAEGEKVNLAALKARGIVHPMVKRVKVLARGELTKKLIIEADSFSEGALEKIQASGSVAKQLKVKPGK